MVEKGWLALLLPAESDRLPARAGPAGLGPTLVDGAGPASSASSPHQPLPRQPTRRPPSGIFDLAP